MGEYGCQWSKPLFSKKLQKVDFVSKQAVKSLKLKNNTQIAWRLSNSQAFSHTR